MIKTYIGVGTNIEREHHALVAYQELQNLAAICVFRRYMNASLLALAVKISTTS